MIECWCWFCVLVYSNVIGKINLQKEVSNLTMREGSRLLNYIRFSKKF